MPWCAHCDRFLSPPTVQGDGTCPSCGRQVEPAPAGTDGATTEKPVALPWHLKLLAGAAAVYLGWRAWQGIAWLVERF
jgi:hypothetical protein